MITQEKFELIKTKLVENRLNPELLLSLGSMFDRIQFQDLNELIAQFHNCAGQFSYLEDFDFGALVLQLIAYKVNDLNLKKRLLVEAIYRARWCVQAASSGSETQARKKHLEDLEKSLNELIVL